MGQMNLRIWDVEHGACATLQHTDTDKLAMIDSGHNATESWYPSTFISRVLRKNVLEYLFVTNADHDHLSDLEGLWQAGIDVRTLTRSIGISHADLRAMKLRDAGGRGLSDDLERFLTIHRDYFGPVPEPFDTSMCGVTANTYWNEYPAATNTNDLSMAVFFNYCGFKILFPGDLERAGWLMLLQRPAFVAELRATNVLLASHHGRESGYCEEVFDYCTPDCIVMSDKEIQHGTQEGMVDRYRQHVKAAGIRTDGGTQRWVLTTRSDGWIQFRVYENGRYDVFVETENG